MLGCLEDVETRELVGRERHNRATHGGAGARVGRERRDAAAAPSRRAEAEDSREALDDGRRRHLRGGGGQWR